MNKKRVLYFVSLVLLLLVSGIVTWKDAVFAEWGDIVLDNKIKSMELAKVSPVLFPHWFHRIRFKCKVCHEKIFIMKAGSNDINMADIINSRYCGKCHNGKIAFSAKECDRCHSYNDKNIYYRRVVEAGQREYSERYAEYRKKFASRVDGTVKDGRSFIEVPMFMGSTSDKEAFRNLEKDKFGLVNWAAAVRQKKIKPMTTIGADFSVEDKMISRKAIIETKSSVTHNVLFPHEIHTYWLACENCHDKIFPKNNAYTMYMTDIVKGEYCGRCHGKIAFPLGDCTRCHNVPKESQDQPLEPMLQ